MVLRVLAEEECPLFSVGDQMVLDLPGVDVRSSPKVCALTIAKLLEEVDTTGCADVASPLERGKFDCPRWQSPVTFEVEGKQYVAIGAGGRIAQTTSYARLTGEDIPQGSGVIWVFALP